MNSELCILVVDDHEPLLAAVKIIMEEHGYKVLTATDGLKALEVMEHIRPDLIIADVMMPRMDGFALYEAIRARPEWVTIPFIFLTARTEKEDRLKGKELGAEDYITKPFDPQELLVAVESRLRRARAIQEASEARFEQLKQRIASVLSHELRTPLTYVRGYTELALEQIQDIPSSPEGIQDFLRGIKKGADRLNRLVEDLLLIVQIDTGRIAEEFNMMVCLNPALEAVLEATIRQYYGYAAEQGVKLELVTERPLPPVRLCEHLFVNALGRLIDNGIKFSQGKRNRDKRVIVSARQADGWVEITVEDKGVGIPTEELPHLFERFRQIDRERMEQQGVGLGLAIARELVRLHGGDIVVDSVYGQGSRFTIRLPVA
ncbi:MAG: hybrid sensor histidine kinase/response regulator [Anaerolineae bacterium]|nr:hybrid sensor histidine kinase/response regulator [Anaerolineae bacterium]